MLSDLHSSKVPISRWGMVMGSLLLGAGLTLLTQSSASAQAAYGSYIGIGGSVGLTDGGNDNGQSAAGVITARYKFLEAPVSIRGQVLIGEATAFVPTVSYDIPLSWQTDFYLGAGAVIQDSDSSYSPLGNQTAFVLQPGFDFALEDSNLVIFTNATVALDAYKNSNDAAASIQAGLGFNFGQ